ncbi:MAG TPA: hypothetical protein VJH04_00395 [archaeon]|nr:hypothetical protein [archaeon]
MTELISIKDMPRELKTFLLEELGYSSDGIFVLDKNQEKLLDRYTNTPIKIDNMIIFPGSTIILDNNPLSISSFLEEFGDVL